ncbi:MAG TPA: hypothetical protein VMR52_09030 [Dehalococcoidia bacterium]|nr:hypothetical protein [Dehalococcoidia bacterium]
MARNTQTNIRQERFSRHFPRLFAYLYAVTGDQELACEATFGSFSTVLNAEFLEEPHFTLALFQAARKLTPKRWSAADGLDSNEREVLSLLFDAQLSRAEVAQLLTIDEQSLLRTVLGGLRKLRAASAVAAPGRLQTLSA